MFGTLAIFAEICRSRLHLPFSYCNSHLSRFPSLTPQLRFCQTFDGFLPNSPFSQICHFRENRQLSICLFCCLIYFFSHSFNDSFAKFANFAKYVIFVNPTIIDHASFVILLNFLPNFLKFFCQIYKFYKIVICQNTPL